MHNGQVIFYLLMYSVDSDKTIKLGTGASIMKVVYL